MSALNDMRLPKPLVLTYAIDARVSRFTVKASATGFLAALGHNPTMAVRNFEGDVHLAADSLADASLHLRIVAASLAVQDEISDKDRREMEDRMRDEVLEVSRFPDIIYDCSDVSGSETSKGQYPVTLNGQLTLHGVTRPVPVSAQVSVSGNTLRASGECTLRQTDYGIKLVSALAGTLRLKDELKLAFDIAARSQKQD